MKKKKKEDKAQKLDLLVEVSKSIEEKIHLAVRELGLYIQMHKETEDCSWEDLEDELGVSESTLQRIANGEKQVYLFTFCMLQNRLRKYGTQPFKILFSEENDSEPAYCCDPKCPFISIFNRNFKDTEPNKESIPTAADDQPDAQDEK